MNKFWNSFGDIIYLCVWTISALIFIGLILGLILFIPTLFWVLWNLVMPYAFGLPVLAWWQAVAMYVLLSIIGGCFKVTKKLAK